MSMLISFLGQKSKKNICRCRYLSYLICAFACECHYHWHHGDMCGRAPPWPVPALEVLEGGDWCVFVGITPWCPVPVPCPALLTFAPQPASGAAAAAH